MTEQQKQQAIEVVKNILHALHGKRYEDLPKCVDEMEWADTDEIRECIQGTLELNDMSAFDKYGAPCNFHPQYEYHQMSFYPYKDGSGFALDYHLTADGGPVPAIDLPLPGRRSEEHLPHDRPYVREDRDEKPSFPKDPWFIWLSFFGLMWVQNRHDAENTTSMTKWSDEAFNRHLGYLGRFTGLFFGIFLVPVLLMLHFIMERMPEPWYTVWNCIILAYTYFSGVFITWRLYRYLNHE